MYLNFLLQKLVHDFLFPASKLVVESRTKNCELTITPHKCSSYHVFFLTAVVAFDYEEKSSIAPICNSIDSTAAAFKLLTALCNGCVENLKTLYGLLHSLFYTGMCVRTHACVCVCVCVCV